MNKNIQINTLSPIYDKIEDRIRLSINYQDINNRIDLMLTRSFLLKLLTSIDEYIHTYYPKNTDMNNPLYIEVEKENSKTHKTNKTEAKKEVEYSKNIEKTNTEDYDLYRSLEDLLVSINLKYDKNTQRTFMQFISKEGYIATINVDITLLQKVLESIKHSIPNMEWGISPHF